MAEQIVFTSDITPQDAGATFSFDLEYTTNPLDETLIGIGFRLHFDSSQLELVGIENIFQENGLFNNIPSGATAEGNDDFDNDANTDYFIGSGWTSISGNFPGEGQSPVTLYTVEFRTTETFTQPTTLNFTEVSTSRGYELNADSITVEATGDFVNQPPILDDVTFPLLENSSNGTVVGVVAATDPEGDSLTYSLSSEAFNINSNSGEITVADGSLLDWETTPSFDLMVGVSDGMAETMAKVTVKLEEVKETSQIFWRNSTTGQNAVWLMEGTAKTEAIQLDPTSNQDWKMVGAGDFNNDGEDDILWRNGSNGKNAVWLMEGTAKTEAIQLDPTSNQDWNIVGTGDFNNDGQDDLLWRNGSNGKNAVWFMEGTTRTGAAQLQATSNLDWNIVGTGDFNNNGQDDLLWRNSATGENAVWLMNGTTRTEVAQLDTTSNLDWQSIA